MTKCIKCNKEAIKVFVITDKCVRIAFPSCDECIEAVREGAKQLQTKIDILERYQNIGDSNLDTVVRRIIGKN